MDSIPERYKPLLSKLLEGENKPSLLSENNVYHERPGRNSSLYRPDIGKTICSPIPASKDSNI
jgi:hypothetical protein